MHAKGRAKLAQPRARAPPAPPRPLAGPTTSPIPRHAHGEHAVPPAAADPIDPGRGVPGTAAPLPASRWRGAEGSFENKAKGRPGGGGGGTVGSLGLSGGARARGDRAPRSCRARAVRRDCVSGARRATRPSGAARWPPPTCHPRNLVAYSCGVGAVTCRTTNWYAAVSNGDVHSTPIKWVLRRTDRPTLEAGGAIHLLFTELFSWLLLRRLA